VQSATLLRLVIPSIQIIFHAQLLGLQIHIGGVGSRLVGRNGEQLFPRPMLIGAVPYWVLFVSWPAKDMFAFHGLWVQYVAESSSVSVFYFFLMGLQILLGENTSATMQHRQAAVMFCVCMCLSGPGLPRRLQLSFCSSLHCFIVGEIADTLRWK
jgi:hypothetical protein